MNKHRIEDIIDGILLLVLFFPPLLIISAFTGVSFPKKKEKKLVKFKLHLSSLDKINYFGSIEKLLNTILKTKKTDWKYEKKNTSVTYHLFKNIYLQAGEENVRMNVTRRYIRLVEGKKHLPLFDEHVTGKSKTFNFIYDSVLSNRKSSERFAEHVLTIYESHKNELEELEIKKEENLKESGFADNDILQEVTQIKKKLTLLQKEEKWLSSESMHRITETLPNDLDNLMDIYLVVEDGKTARIYVERALLSLNEKISIFQTEIEKNKILKLQQIETVIAKR